MKTTDLTEILIGSNRDEAGASESAKSRRGAEEKLVSGNPSHSDGVDGSDELAIAIGEGIGRICVTSRVPGAAASAGAESPAGGGGGFAIE
jgi:hypothetical protein